MDLPPGNGTDPARYRFDYLTAEFAFPATEEAFREYSRPRRVRDTRMAMIMAALIFLGFALIDFRSIGICPGYVVDLTIRLSVCAGGLTGAYFADRYWRALVNGLLPTLITGMGMAGFLAITLIRPYEVGWQGMSMMAMLLGIYAFIPNRFLPALLVCLSASLAFLWLSVAHYQLSGSQIANLTALLLVLNLLGSVIAYRISKMTREQYRDAAVLRQANTRLEEEVGRRCQLEQELRQRAEQDEVTGLPNRQRFLELGESRLPPPLSQVPLTVMLIDVDYLKELNNTYGHTRGDEVLKALAEVCRRHMAQADILARLSGEEFALLMPGVSRAEATVKAERLRGEAQNTAVSLTDVALHFTVSVGVAQWHPGESLGALLRRADEAIANAKYKGRNRVELAV